MIMEVLYENLTPITKDLFNEASYEVFKLYKLLRNFVLLFLIICIIFAALCLIAQGFSWPSLYFIFLTLLLLFLYFKGYLLSTTRHYKNYQALYGEYPQLKTRFYENKFEVISPISNFTIDYNKLTGIKETKNLYLLMIRKQCFMLIKNGFIIGNAHDFILFINEKCQDQINKS